MSRARRVLKRRAGEIPPCLLGFLPLFFTLLHVVEHPVPHDEETGDDHVGKQPRAEECSGDDEFVVHRAHFRRGR